MAFYTGFTRGSVIPANVKNLCTIASGSLGQMDIQARHGVA